MFMCNVLFPQVRLSGKMGITNMFPRAGLFRLLKYMQSAVTPVPSYGPSIKTKLIT